MLAIRIERLVGTTAAPPHGEWPPDPSRLFSALVAAWASAAEPDSTELASLGWIAQEGPPEIAFTAGEGTRLQETTRRLPIVERVIDHLVHRAGLLPPQARPQAHLPRAANAQVLWFVWRRSPPNDVVEALSRLARRLARLAPSTEPISASIDPDPPAARCPDEGGPQILRHSPSVPRGPRPAPIVLPSRAQRRSGVPDVDERPPILTPSAHPDDWIVFRRVGGPRLPMTSTVAVATAFRDALVAAAGRSPEPELSGDEADGAPLDRPDAAFVPLPSVTSPRADGTILGVALVLPSCLDPAARQAILRSVATSEDRRRRETGELDLEAPPLRLRAGRSDLEIERVARGEPYLHALRASTWRGPSRVWVSATPVALDRNPGDLHHPHPGRRALAFAAARRSLAEACEATGLPPPLTIEVARSALLPGSSRPRHFPPYPWDPTRIRRVLVHARLEFEEAIDGPVLLGAGRYLGLGLFLPFPSAGS